MLKNRYGRRESSLLLRPSQMRSPIIQKIFHSPGKDTPILKYSSTGSSENLAPLVPSKSCEVYSKSNNIERLSEIDGEPVADPNIVSVLSSPVDLSDLFVIEYLPELPPIFSIKFHSIFAKKVEMCKKPCAFRKNKKEDMLAAEIKESTLKEILDLFGGSTPPTNIMDEKEISLLYDMITANIQRKLPTIDKKFLYFDDLPTFCSPQWPHLSLIYQLLNRLVNSIPFSNLFSIENLKQFIPVFSTPDPNERICLINFFKNLLSHNFNPATQLLIEFDKVIHEYLAQDNPSPYPVSIILPLMQFIFDTNPTQLQQFTRIFVLSILPLISDQHINMFEEPFRKFVDFFTDDNELIARRVIRKVILNWPRTNTSKQLIFLEILLSTLPRLAPKDFHSLYRRAFMIISECILSPHEKIALNGISIWSRVDIKRLLFENAKNIIPIIFPAISIALSQHWSVKVRQSARISYNIIMKSNAVLIRDYTAQKEHLDKEMTERNNKKLQCWMALIKLAQGKDEKFDAGQIFILASEQFCETSEPKTISRVQIKKSRANSTRVSSSLPNL